MENKNNPQEENVLKQILLLIFLGPFMLVGVIALVGMWLCIMFWICAFFKLVF